MKQLDNWDGKNENTSIKYDYREVESAEPSPSSNIKADLTSEYDTPDKTDYIVAAALGILAGIIASFWIDEFSLSKAQNWGRSKADRFVLKIAQLKGYGKSDLEGAIRYLEKTAPIPSDQHTSIWGGALQHHFRDFAYQ